MPYVPEYSHVYSVKVYQEAEQDAKLRPEKYEDLGELVDELCADSPDISAPVAPAEIALANGAVPNLVIVDDEPELTDILRRGLVEWDILPSISIRSHCHQKRCILQVTIRSVSHSSISNSMVDPYQTPCIHRAWRC
jgi:hypothetical protein